MAEKKASVGVKLKSKIEEFHSKKQNKQVKQEVFSGFVKIKGQSYLIKLNPKRKNSDGTDWLKGDLDNTFLWVEVVDFGESSFKGL